MQVQLDPDLASDLVKGLCLKNYICTVNPLYDLAEVATFHCTCSPLTYQVSDAIRILTTSRSNHEGRPCPRGEPSMQLTAVQDCSKGSGLSTM